MPTGPHSVISNMLFSLVDSAVQMQLHNESTSLVSASTITVDVKLFQSMTILVALWVATRRSAMGTKRILMREISSAFYVMI